jgi:hypothetical protein
MGILLSGSKRIALGIVLIGGLALTGCESGGGSDAAIATVKDGEHGKAQKAAREAAYGPTGIPQSTKGATPKPAAPPAGAGAAETPKEKS